MIKYTSDRCVEYTWFAKQCLKLNTYGSKAVSDRGFVILCKYTPKDATLVMLGDNFVCHPRAGEIQTMSYLDNTLNIYPIKGVFGGGWDETHTELATRYIYPLEDFDKGTWGIDIDNTQPKIAWTSAENYGNCWWQGVDGTVLSWKGPPNRHWNLDSTFNVPGLSRTENVVSQTEFYTMFDKNVYSGGEILCTLPTLNILDPMDNLVVGACYYQSKLIIMAVSRTDIYRFSVYTSDDSGVTLNRIGNQLQTTRAHIPCFITPLGNIFTFDKTTYIISQDVSTFSVYQEAPAEVGTISEPVSLGGYWYDGVFNISGSRPIAVEPDITERYDITFSSNTTSLGGSGERTISAPVVINGVRPTFAVSVTNSGSDAYGSTLAVGDVANATGSACGGTISYSMTNGSIHPTTGVVQSIGCGMSTITAITSNGESASVTTRLPTGTWVLQSSGTSGHYGGPAPEYVFNSLAVSSGSVSGVYPIGDPCCSVPCTNPGCTCVSFVNSVTTYNDTGVITTVTSNTKTDRREIDTSGYLIASSPSHTDSLGGYITTTTIYSQTCNGSSFSSYVAKWVSQNVYEWWCSGTTRGY